MVSRWRWALAVALLAAVQAAAADAAPSEVSDAGACLLQRPHAFVSRGSALRAPADAVPEGAASRGEPQLEGGSTATMMAYDDDNAADDDDNNNTRHQRRCCLRCPRSSGQGCCR